jgi:hypothetical protein
MQIAKNRRTDVDVDLLWTVFPDLLPDGREVTHDQIEAVLKESRISSRYRTVVTKWRKRLLRERAIYLDGMTAKGRGFVVLTPDEMVRFGNRSVRQAGRKVKKAIAVASLPNDEALSVDTRRYRGLLMVALEKIATEHKATLKAVSKALQPMQQLPRASGQ